MTAASNLYLGHEAHNADEIVQAYNIALGYRKELQDAIAQAQKAKASNIKFMPYIQPGKRASGSYYANNTETVSSLKSDLADTESRISRMDASLRSSYHFAPEFKNNTISNWPPPGGPAGSVPTPVSPSNGGNQPSAPSGGGGGGGGDSSVRQLQTDLRNAGFDPGPIDGIMGPKTRAAMAARDRANGGGGGGGGSAPSGGGGNTATAAPMDDEAVKAFLRQNYGYLAAYYDDPEIGPILRQAAQQGITDEARLEGMLFPTQWWQHMSQTARQWDALGKTDPATAQQQLQSKIVDIGNKAAQFGIPLAADRQQSIANDAMRFGWTDAEISRALSTELHYNPNAATQGRAAEVEAQIKALQGQWLVPISDHTAFDMAQQVVAGTMNMDGITENFRQLALGKFPTMKDAIEKYGYTPTQVMDPFKEEAARLLEVAPTQIDFLNDPRFTAMLDYADPKTGQKRLMQVNEAQNYIRSLDAFKTTKQANETAANMIMGLGQVFGKLPSSIQMPGAA